MDVTLNVYGYIILGMGHNMMNWRDQDDIIPIQCFNSEKFDLNQELAVKIKSSLLGNRKCSPVIRLAMPFDLMTFNEGLRISGHAVRTARKSFISRYEDMKN